MPSPKDQLANTIAQQVTQALAEGVITADEAMDLGRDINLAIFAGTNSCSRYVKKEFVTKGAKRFPYLATAAKAAGKQKRKGQV